MSGCRHDYILDRVQRHYKVAFRKFVSHVFSCSRVCLCFCITLHVLFHACLNILYTVFLLLLFSRTLNSQGCQCNQRLLHLHDSCLVTLLASTSLAALKLLLQPSPSPPADLGVL